MNLNHTPIRLHSRLATNTTLRQNIRQPLQALRATSSYSTSTARRPHAISSPSSSAPPSLRRLIHSTPALCKKSRDKNNAADEPRGGKGGSGGKHTSKHGAPASSASSGAGDDGSGGGGPAADPADPLNFDDVRARHAKQAEYFLEKLKKFRAGGRFNPDVIASLPVSTDKATGESYPLRELGQVVPKGGRTISIILHEAAYIKPVMSAIQASPDFNQQPQRDPDNELELVLKIEAESPEDVGKRIKALCHDWRSKVKLIRQKRDKQHTSWRKDGLILADDKKLADKELEKVIKALNADIDANEKETLKLAQV